MYYVNWVLTTAQLELLASDVSVVDYGTDKKRKKGEYDNTPADSESIRKANEDWLSRYGDGENAGKNIAFSDIFRGKKVDDIGVKLKE